jgi:hypothetical protein
VRERGVGQGWRWRPGARMRIGGCGAFTLQRGAT